MSEELQPNDNTETDDGLINPHDDDNRKLYCDDFEEFRDAVERLYVIGNLSGRLKFTAQWPHAAQYILGDELIKFDCEGAVTEEEKERRAELEEEAQETQNKLSEMFMFIDDRLILDGSLNLEALENIMQEFNRYVCLYMFEERFVNRFHPPGPEDIKKAEEEAEQAQDNTPPQPPQPKSNKSDDSHADPKIGKVNTPPPASPASAPQTQGMPQMANNDELRGDVDDRKQAMMSGGEFEHDQTHEHIGHADHSLSQNMATESDIGKEPYEDPLENIHPISLDDEQAAQEAAQKQAQAEQTPPEITPQDDVGSAPIDSVHPIDQQPMQPAEPIHQDSLASTSVEPEIHAPAETPNLDSEPATENTIQPEPPPISDTQDLGDRPVETLQPTPVQEPSPQPFAEPEPPQEIADLKTESDLEPQAVEEPAPLAQTPPLEPEKIPETPIASEEPEKPVSPPVIGGASEPPQEEVSSYIPPEDMPKQESVSKPASENIAPEEDAEPSNIFKPVGNNKKPDQGSEN